VNNSVGMRCGERSSMKATESKGKPAQAPRRRYDETFKRHAVELTLQGHRRVTNVASELGVPESMLYAWRRLYAPRPAGSGERPRTLEEAEAENSRLRAEQRCPRSLHGGYITVHRAHIGSA
jgi:transposase